MQGSSDAELALHASLRRLSAGFEETTCWVRRDDVLGNKLHSEIDSEISVNHTTVPLRSRTATTTATTCFICGLETCKRITHRLITLESRRRVAKQKRRKNTKPILDEASNHPNVQESTKSDSSTLVLPANPLTMANGWLDLLSSFAITGRQKSTVPPFHDFFTKCTEAMHSTRHSPSDDGHPSRTLSTTMQNQALCMSFAAMAATHTGIHDRNLRTPDAQILRIYSESFEALRKQIREEEETKEISEATIMAAANLVMCFGVGFQDPTATLTHWQGVLSLMQKPQNKLFSGSTIAFVDFLEYWLVLTLSVKPRSDSWPMPIVYERQPRKIYGRAMERMLTALGTVKPRLSLKILQVCVNSCRATELLEACVDRCGPTLPPSSESYFIYLRGVIMAQGAHVYHRLEHTNTFDECMSITMSLYCIIVLRLTPWVALLQHLCSELRRALSNYEANSGLERCRCGAHVCDMSDDITDDEDWSAFARDAHIWVIVISACAAQLSRDQPHLQWAVDHLRKVYTQLYQEYGSIWKHELLDDLRAFCWSKTFLSGYFDGICRMLESG